MSLSARRLDMVEGQDLENGGVSLELFGVFLVLDLSDVWKWTFGLKTWIYFGVLDQKSAVFQWIKYGLL